MNKEEINWLKEHLYEIYKYKKGFGQYAAPTYDMNIELLNKTCKALDYLQQENKQLKENYCNRTDCSGRIKNSKKYDSLQQKYNKQLDNWNKLKECIENEMESKYIHKYDVLDKIQELEDK